MKYDLCLCEMVLFIYSFILSFHGVNYTWTIAVPVTPLLSSQFISSLLMSHDLCDKSPRNPIEEAKFAVKFSNVTVILKLIGR